MKTKIQQEVCLIQWHVHDVICLKIQSSKNNHKKRRKISNLLQSVWKCFWSSLQAILTHYPVPTIINIVKQEHPSQEVILETKCAVSKWNPHSFIYLFCCTIVNHFNCLPARPISGSVAGFYESEIREGFKIKKLLQKCPFKKYPPG